MESENLQRWWRTNLEVGDLDIKVIVGQGCNMRPLSVGIENICIGVIKENLKYITNFKISNKNWF